MLLQAMAGVGDVAARRARFVCALVAVRSADDPEPLVALGRWPGRILTEPRGEAGFGYDPLMFIEALGCSAAELSAADKNAHSHRGMACRAMLDQMREVWGLG
jgi:XTP/dITP diphosphohydrolase